MIKNSNWVTISQKYVYESKWMKLRHDDVIKPDGNTGGYDVLEKRDFVVLVCIIDGKFVLVEQDRYPIGERSLEFSQGNIEEGETPEDAARREFEEETGYKAKELKKLGKVWLACGYSNQAYYVFFIEGVSHGERKLEGSEADMKTKFLTEYELENDIRNSIIKDASTITAYSLYQLEQRQTR